MCATQCHLFPFGFRSSVAWGFGNVVVPRVEWSEICIIPQSPFRCDYLLPDDTIFCSLMYYYI